MIELGVVNEARQCVFEFENRSERIVHIRRLRPSCSCSAANVTKMIFQPGEKGQITLDVKPKLDQIGTQYYILVVEYDGEQPRQIELRAQLENRPNILIPTRVRLRCVVGLTQQDEIVIVDYRNEPLEINDIVVSSQDLSLQLLESPKKWLPGWRYRFSLNLQWETVPRNL